METLFEIPEDLSALSDEEVQAFIDAAKETATKVAASPTEFVGEGRTAAELTSEMQAGVEAIEAAKAELASRKESTETEDEEEETPAEPSDEAELDTDAIAELAARATAEETPAAVEAETPEAPKAEQITAELSEVKGIDIAEIVTKTVEATAAAFAKQNATPADASEKEETVAETPVTAAAEDEVTLARPARSRHAEPVASEETAPSIALTAMQSNLGVGIGDPVDTDQLSRMMIRRRADFGRIAEGTHDKVPIARADWSELYGEERTLHHDFESDTEKIEAVVADATIRSAFAARKAEAPSLTASGGLCAPVTPYYSLQMLSVADRPVRAALPSFNADRGGINAARPASLGSIDDAIGIISEADDALGGTFATKTCQRIDCPTFVEVDVDTIYHCLEFGNLGARTYPELVAQWTSLTLAAHARMAETNLLDGIGAASTAVTAASLGYGASAALLGQILAAANGMRSRHRMRQDAVLRIMLPSWVGDLIVSDVSRGQFDRFDMTPERWVSLLRAGNVEPTFYIDTQTAAGQVFGTQAASALLSFPANVVWYLFPEGSFLYLDGGTLELGLVRDSVLNSTNDFQIFGETFENVAFIGVESLKVTSAVCDTGVVAAPDDPAYDCTNYS